MGLFLILSGVLFLQTASAVLFDNSSTQSACYGSVDSVFINASCDHGFIMAPYIVRVGSKLNLTGCKAGVSTTLNQTEFDRCCTYNSSDCTSVYRNVNNTAKTYVYHEDCVGYKSCKIKQATWMSTSTMGCRPLGDYLGTSNYISLDYFCIKELTIVGLPYGLVQTRTNDALSIMTYKKTDVAEGYCEVETAVGATITVEVIDLNLMGSQRITVNTTAGIMHLTAPNRFSFNTFLNSTSNQLSLEFNNTEGLEWQFWIAFKALGSNNLKITCKDPYSTPIPPLPFLMKTLPLSEETKKKGMIIAVAVVSTLVAAFIAAVALVVVRHRYRLRLLQNNATNTNTIEERE